MNQTIHTTATAVFQDIECIRQQSPLIHNITNFVTMQQIANALLALGASPIMAHAPEEMTQIVGLANALVINIGTLETAWLQSMEQAVQLAKKEKIPIIIDPVGAGATDFRTHALQHLLQLASPTIIRGNASEILGLVDRTSAPKGVDSKHQTSEAESAAMHLAKKYQCTVVVSGATDICVNEKGQQHAIYNGHALMAKVTGMGCTATAVIGAFAAVNPDPLLAAVHAMITMGIAGENAAAKAQGPGSFNMHFLDELSTLTASTIAKKLRHEVLFTK